MELQHRQNLVKLAIREAERVRSSLEISRDATIDPIDLSVNYGCETRFLKLPSLEGIYSPEPRPTIVLGAERPAGRKRFTCAHELAHHVFKHDVRFEVLQSHKVGKNSPDEEFLADVFAGFILMPQVATIRALKDRQWDVKKLTPEQAYKLANCFGVGYATIINHLSLSLQLISKNQAKELNKTQPKHIKTKYRSESKADLVFVDYHWRHRPVDIDIGDTLIIPSGTIPKNDRKMTYIRQMDGAEVFKANKSGYSRAICNNQNWGINIRIAPKQYEGLAQYRFLNESEED